MTDVNLEVTQPNSDSSQLVGLTEVVGTTIGPLILGTLLLVAVVRWRPGAWRTVAWLGLALGVLTVPMPLSAEAEWAAKVTLASMHVITGRRLVRRTHGARPAGLAAVDLNDTAK